MPYYNRDPKRDHNFDDHPWGCITQWLQTGIPSANCASSGVADMGGVPNTGTRCMDGGRKQTPEHLAGLGLVSLDPTSLA